MTKFNTIKIPGMFNKDTAVVAKSGDVFAIATNKWLVITTEDFSEWLGDTTYLVTNFSDEDADETYEDAEFNLSSEDDMTVAVQSAAQMVLDAGNPRPRTAKFLESLLVDDEFAARRIRRSIRLANKREAA